MMWEVNIKKIRQGGDFFKIKETISILKKNKVPVQVSMVVHNQNYKHIYDVYMFCVENKVDYIRYVPLFVHENTELRVIRTSWARQSIR